MTKRTIATSLLLLAAAVPSLAQVGRAEPAAETVLDAIVELDVQRAHQLLKEYKSSARAPLERAQLALYTGDCDTAQAVLSAPSISSTREGEELLALATSCAKATAGALIIKDDVAGVHVRLQDARDEPLVPFIVRVSVQARAAMQRDLGVDLPKPLRIDLVRDTFSLSALTGLPVEAADTTGTLAVARWGRVTMISPRATRLGYGWEDTLAHEITHLALARATRDRAPLWLQEGIAKREETRWRKPRPGDGHPSADSIAYQAMQSGRSVGIDKLGPSIAMLPTPEAASIAYAEVQSFVNYWITQNGEAALKLLFADLKGLADSGADAALRSVSGYNLAEWNLKWRQHLKQHPPKEPDEQQQSPHNPRTFARWLRLTDLLHGQGHYEAAAATIEPALDPGPAPAPVRWRAARAQLARGETAAARQALGNIGELDIIHGAWFALHGRFLEQENRLAQAESAFALAVAVDPLFDEVACQGRRLEEDFSPASAEQAALCRAARDVARAGAP